MEDLAVPDKYVQLATELSIFLLTKALMMYELAAGWIADYFNVP